MVSAAKARHQAPPVEEVITVKCFKCKFFSTNDDFLNKHMTLQHLMGRGLKRMEKFVALATPNLLVSNGQMLHGQTLHGQVVLGHLLTVNDSPTSLKCPPRYFPGGGGGGEEINANSVQLCWSLD